MRLAVALAEATRGGWQSHPCVAPTLRRGEPARAAAPASAESIERARPRISACSTLLWGADG